MDLTYEVFESSGFIEIILGIIDYISENRDKEAGHEEDDAKYRNPEEIKRMLQELMYFLMQSFDERMELFFFFKTCFFRLDFGLKDFRKFLLALGVAYKKILEGEGGEEDEVQDDSRSDIEVEHKVEEDDEEEAIGMEKVQSGRDQQ